MTVTTVLVGYTTLTATLALVISLLILRSLQAGVPPLGTAVRLPDSGPDRGSPAPPFSARTTTGELLRSDQLTGQSYLLAFVSSSCQGCRAALPGMTGYAGELPGRLIAVIVGDPRRAVDIETALAPLAAIVLEPEAGPIASLYRIHLFPTYVLVSGSGTVLATGQSVRDLPQPQPR